MDYLLLVALINALELVKKRSQEKFNENK